MRLACIVGARPNFMKIAPILRAFNEYPELKPVLIHTGQHYDPYLSDIFFEELGINRPDIALGVGSSTHAKQTADIMIGMEQIFLDAAKNNDPFDRVVVVGDVNSTAAAAMAAVKLHIPVTHVEAGLRSSDRRMPEEINRVVTDAISDMLLVSEPAGVENLLKEGHPQDQIHLVGNVMIDTLKDQIEKARDSSILDELNLQKHQFGVITLHRPSNVDRQDVLEALVDVLIDVSSSIPLVFPVHPRTKCRLEDFGLYESLSSAANVHCLGPRGYLDFLCLTSNSKVIVTDSGGLQEESTALGIPCLTMRENTERPITCTEGTSTLIGNDSEKLHEYLTQVIENQYKTGKCPKLWDGRAAERIAKVLVSS